MFVKQLTVKTGKKLLSESQAISPPNNSSVHPPVAASAVSISFLRRNTHAIATAVHRSASAEIFSREPRSFEGCKLFVQARLLHMHFGYSVDVARCSLAMSFCFEAFHKHFPRRQKFAAQVLAVLALKVCKRYPFVSVAICLCY